MGKTIKVGEKSYTIKELKYKDIVAVSEMSKSDVAKSLLIKSTGINEAEYDELSMKEGIEIMKHVNEFNGLVGADFQVAEQTSN